MRSRIILLLSLLCTCVSGIYAQRYSEEPIYEGVSRASQRKVFYGGSIAVTFSQPVFFSVAPIVGYQVTQRYHVGIGIPYIYSNNFGQKSNLFGFRYFNQFFVFGGAMLHLEYELMNYPRSWTDGTATPQARSYEHGFNAGVGYRQHLTSGKTAWIDLYLLYNTRWKNGVSIYSSPFVLRTVIAFK